MFESLVGTLEDRSGVKRPLTKGSQLKQNNVNKIPCFYTNARSLRNTFAELNTYVSQEKPDIIKDLKFSKQCLLEKHKANLKLGIIARRVSYKSAEVISKLYRSYFRPHLEC